MHRFLLFTLLFVGCKTTQPSPPIPTETKSGEAILTVIFKIDPSLDTLTVFDIVRGPGRLRTEYGPAAVAGPGELLFTFLDANGSTLRQTARPYPGPNRYEGPGESGEILSTELPDEPRSLVLKTQASRRLHRLEVTGELPSGTRLHQRIDLRAKD